MKDRKKMIFFYMVILSMTIVFCGCGTNSKAGGSDDGTQNDKVNLYSPGEFGTTTEKGIQPEQYGNDSEMNNGKTDSYNENNSASQNAMDDVSDVAEGVGNTAEDIVDDVADGVGDAIDNLGGGSFDKYEDAKEYLLGKLQKDNVGAKYEIKEENKDLTAYNHNDSGAEGYQFSVYETDRNEKIGIYYVDKDTGKIYRYMGKNSIEAY